MPWIRSSAARPGCRSRPTADSSSASCSPCASSQASIAGSSPSSARAASRWRSRSASSPGRQSAPLAAASASAISASVTPCIAEATTTCTGSGASSIRSATRRMRAASASELPPNLCARQRTSAACREGSVASCAGTAFIGAPVSGASRRVRLGHSAPSLLRAGRCTWKGYPGMTDRTGVIPVVVVVMVVRPDMARLCCSAAKAVKRWLRLKPDVRRRVPARPPTRSRSCRR